MVAKVSSFIFFHVCEPLCIIEFCIYMESYPVLPSLSYIHRMENRQTDELKVFPSAVSIGPHHRTI